MEEAAAAQQRQDQQPATADASAAPAVPAAASPPQQLSQMLLRPPSQSSSTLLPLQGMTPMQRLAHAGLVAKVGGGAAQPAGRTVLLPTGARVLDKIERVLLDELASLQAQEVQLSPADLGLDAQSVRRSTHAAAVTAPATDAPYPTSLASELPVLTELLSGEFGSAARGPYRLPLRSASLRVRVSHGAGAASPGAASLWSAPKHTLDFISMHSSRRRALDAYHHTLDGMVRSLTHVGLKPLLLEASPRRTTSSHAVDADLAHEVHVVLPQTEAHARPSGIVGSVLKCSKCEYAARRERAVSKLDDTALPAPSAAGTAAADRPTPLQRHLRQLVEQQLALHFPERTVQQLGLTVDAAHWRCELVIDRASVLGAPSDADTEADAVALPIAYLVLLRRDDELNLTALAEHVGSAASLQRVEDTTETVEVLAALLSGNEELLDSLQISLPPLLQSALLRARDAPVQRVNPLPELLLDQALLPHGMDLDLEAMQHAEEQEALAQARAAEEEEQRAAEEAEAAAAQAIEDVDDSPLDEAATAALHARMERGMLSSARTLAPGQSLDLVAVELAAQGKDVRAEQARLYAEGEAAQRLLHEEQEREREQRRRDEMEEARRTAEALGEEDEAGNFSASGEAGADAGADGSEEAASDSFSASSGSSAFGLSLSRQGSFRLALPGERCAIASCDDGVLEPVRTVVLANGVFVGRQELVRSAQKKKQLKATREYVHTSYARFSPLDAMTMLAQQYLVAPALGKSRAGSAASGGAVSLDTLTRLQWPALVAPFQCALLPVLSADSANKVASTNLRDLHRSRANVPNAADAAAADERTWSVARDLHTELLSLAAAAPSPASGNTDFLYPSLSGDVLVDDRTDLPINARVQSLVAAGVPILLLLQPRGLAAGQVSLVLNRPGVSLQPRKVALDGLAPLLLQMLRAAHGPVIQARRKQREEEEQRREEELEREQRAKQEQLELLQLQAEADELAQG